MLTCANLGFYFTLMLNEILSIQFKFDTGDSAKNMERNLLFRSVPQMSTNTLKLLLITGTREYIQ